MHDIEALTKRIILIGKGRTLYDGNVDTLKSKFPVEGTIEETIAAVYKEYEI